MKNLVYTIMILTLVLMNACMEKELSNPLDPANGVLTVAQPTFSPPGGWYSSEQTVTISCATAGAMIRYTIDGSDPIESSSLYTTPLQISAATVLKAGAFKSGWPDSQIASATYSFAVAKPSITPPSGWYSSEQTVTIFCASPEATIRYTIDGSEPSGSSLLYTAPLQISAATVLKARGYKSGWSDSQIASATYSFSVATPVINPPGGTYESSQTVTITCATPGATIRYTIDGSEPESTSPVYTNPFSISDDTTVKAKGFKAGWSASSTAIATYEFVIYVSGGTFHNGTSNVTLSSFYIDKYELTQAEYMLVMGTNPSWFSGNPNCPVERVTWYGTIEYCNRRSLQEGLTPCYSYLSFGTNTDDWPEGWNTNNSYHMNVNCNWTATGYRLPTEMEWMFAAKGGNLSQGYPYSGSNEINTVAWYNSNSDGQTHDVGGKASNELGIYDMSGNVYEWVWDIYYDSYPSNPQTDPHGPMGGSSRVVRGGSFLNDAYGCTISVRGSSDPTNDSYFGFRVCRISP